MTQSTIHNPDRYMVDFRHILSQGRKRIGLLVGAGAPVSVKVDSNRKISATGMSLIPDISGITKKVLEGLNEEDKKVIEALLPDLDKSPNIETILTRVRRLSEALGSVVVHGKDSKGFEGIAENICKKIGEIVSAELPAGQNPYTELVSWIGGTHREHPSRYLHQTTTYCLKRLLNARICPILMDLRAHISHFLIQQAYQVTGCRQGGLGCGKYMAL